MRGLVVLSAVASVGATIALSEDGIQPETLARLKGATAFVKVAAGGESGSGSGFVVEVAGDSAYVVTNHHVIEPKVIQIVMERGRGVPFPPRHGPRFGPRGPSFELTPRVIVQTLKDAKATVILYSGTPKEEVLSAEVLAADPELDLAVLKVSGVKEVPQPLDLGHEPKLTETMSVYVLGFPFGEVLATGKGNPAITIGRGFVSSLRLDERGELAVVQIDGALNPGNSGGPVVDSQGKLVGVAVATIKDSSGIGLAIPSQHLSRMVQGRVGATHLYASQDEDGIVTIHIEANLVDPLGKIKSVVLNYLAANMVPENVKPSDLLSELPNCRKLPLSIDGRLATGELRLRKGFTEVAMRYQVSGVHGLGHELRTDSVVETIRPPAAAPPFEWAFPRDRGSGPPRNFGSLPPRSRVQPSPATKESRPAAASEAPPPETKAPPSDASQGGGTQFSPKNGSFTITMPLGERSSQGGGTFSVRGVPLSLEMSLRTSDGITYISQSIGTDGSATPAEQIELFRDALASQCQGSIVSENSIRQGSWEGKEFRIEGHGKFTRARMFVVGNDMLCALVTGNTKDDVSSPKAEAFFASFRIARAK